MNVIFISQDLLRLTLYKMLKQNRRVTAVVQFSCTLDGMRMFIITVLHTSNPNGISNIQDINALF